MMGNIYIQNEAKKGFNDWTKEGLGFLLQREDKDLVIGELAKRLDKGEIVEFKYNNLYYEIFESSDSGFIVNIYSNDQKDEDGEYLEENNIDGGLCTGSAKDAIEFML